MTPRLIMALAIAPGASAENSDTEPVLVELTPTEVILTGDAGEQLVFDRAEFLALLAEQEREVA